VELANDPSFDDGATYWDEGTGTVGVGNYTIEPGQYAFQSSTGAAGTYLLTINGTGVGEVYGRIDTVAVTINKTLPATFEITASRLNRIQVYASGSQVVLTDISVQEVLTLTSTATLDYGDTIALRMDETAEMYVAGSLEDSVTLPVPIGDWDAITVLDSVSDIKADSTIDLTDIIGD